ncbi:MAG: class D beta-lactamase [Bernardetiaceae bacterium]|nr:class D beta-lactamase [Bernardetiaceae bacterium]
MNAIYRTYNRYYFYINFFLILLPFVFGFAVLSSPIKKIKSNDFEAIFKTHKIKAATFILYDLKANKYNIYEKERAEKRFSPGSSFHVFNSLVILEENAVDSVGHLLTWNETPYPKESWNQDHSLRTALPESVTWFFQNRAQTIGIANYDKWLRASDYGNHKTGGSSDMFWITGGLRVSAKEQIDFLVQLYKEELPFKKKNQQQVKNIMLIEQTEDYKIYAKTGWAVQFRPNIAWCMGFVEAADENVYFFAMNMNVENDEQKKLRLRIPKEVLSHIEVIQQSESENKD